MSPVEGERWLDLRGILQHWPVGFPCVTVVEEKCEDQSAWGGREDEQRAHGLRCGDDGQAC